MPDQRQAHQRAQHQGVALAEVEGVGGGEGQLVAEGDDRVDHAERDAAEHQLGQDLHTESGTAVKTGEPSVRRRPVRAATLFTRDRRAHENGRAGAAVSGGHFFWVSAPLALTSLTLTSEAALKSAS